MSYLVISLGLKMFNVELKDDLFRQIIFIKKTGKIVIIFKGTRYRVK